MYSSYLFIYFISWLTTDCSLLSPTDPKKPWFCFLCILKLIFRLMWDHECVCMHHFLKFIYQRRPVSYLSYCKLFCNEHGMQIFLWGASVSFVYIYQGEGLLGHVVLVLIYTFLETFPPFSTMAIPIYISTQRAQKFPFSLFSC
jgi:hypothetical protein